MNHNKVKPDRTLAGSRIGSASEGLRILARMIARHLLTEKPGMDRQRPSGCKPDISDALMGEEASDG